MLLVLFMSLPDWVKNQLFFHMAPSIAETSGISFCWLELVCACKEMGEEKKRGIVFSSSEKTAQTIKDVESEKLQYLDAGHWVTDKIASSQCLCKIAQLSNPWWRPNMSSKRLKGPWEWAHWENF